MFPHIELANGVDQLQAGLQGDHALGGGGCLNPNIHCPHSPLPHTVSSQPTGSHTDSTHISYSGLLNALLCGVACKVVFDYIQGLHSEQRIYPESMGFGFGPHIIAEQE